MGSRPQTHAVMALLFIGLSLTGCGTKPPEPTNEYKIALQGLDASWLVKCQGLEDIPDRKVGTLLQDFVDLTKVAVPCRADHNALLDYLKPLIDKAKAGEPQ